MRSLLRLLPYHRRYWLPFWAGNAALLAARLFEALIPQQLKRGIDGIALGDAALGAAAAVIALCVLGRYAAIRVGRRAVRRVGFAVAYDLRNRLYAHLQRQGPAFYRSHRTGDLMARAINDVGVVRRVIAQGTRTVLVLAFSALVGLAFMLHESAWLTLHLLPALPVIFLAAFSFARRVHERSLAVQQGFSDLCERVQENLSGIRTIQMLAQEDAEIRRFERTNDAYVRRNLALVRTSSVLASVMPTLGACGTLVVVGFGGSRVLSGEMTVGSFAAFLWYLGMVLWPVREAANMILLFQTGAAGTERLFELLDAPPEIAERPGAAGAAVAAGTIELRGLSYRYPGSTLPVLDKVDLEVAAGETLAVLGSVGSGKSTLLELLVRLLDPPPGSVFIDGRDVRELPLAALRAQVALAPQEPFLFSDTLRENATYDAPERPLEQVWRAARAAALDETLDELPDGIETPVGERGVMLSGGQKQRVTLARALVREAPVLLLDDPFSSVDSETEARILGELLELRRGRTTVIVSHRISAARVADRVALLERGRLVECGSRAELLARDGAYAALERSQTERERLLERLDREEGEGEAA